MKFVIVTIKPVEKRDRSGFKYHLSVDTNNPNPWVQHGVHDSPEAVLQAFEPPLSIGYQKDILEKLFEREAISFSLEHDYDSL
jgi:hypothetical protein